MRRVIIVLVAVVLAWCITPVQAEKLSLRLQAGQLVGLNVGVKALPASGLGGFYVRSYSAKTGPNILLNSELTKLPDPLPDRFSIDAKQQWKGQPTLTITLPHDKITDSGFLDLRAPVKSGRVYLLRFAHKGDHLGGELPPIIHVRQLDANGNFVTTQNNIELISGSYDWKEETLAIPAIDGASMLEFSLHHPVGTGTFWISEMTLSEIAEQPAAIIPGQWIFNDDTGRLEFHGRIPGKEIALVADVQAGDDALRINTTLVSPREWLTKHPTALIVSFRLPVNAVGWRWGDYLRQERTIESGKDYSYLHTIGLRQLRLVSWFPLAAISGPEHGLALTVPMTPTTFHRLKYASRGALEVEFDLGLAVRGTGQFESTQFSFDILRYDPPWGYRAALAAYYARYPQFFASTAKEGGWWIGPSHEVKNLTDFGMQYAEDHFAHPDRTLANNKMGIYTCSYSEPWMWRIETMGPEVKDIADVPSAFTFLPQLERDANLPPDVMDDHDYWPAPRRDSVRAFLNSAIYGVDGKIAVTSVRSYGMPVIELSTSCLPKIRSVQWGEMNRGLLSYKYETLADAERVKAAGAKVDGVYFDSVGDWPDIAAEDHRTEHFQYATFPLTFSYATGTPVISGLSAMAEYMAFIKEKNYVTMANSDAKYCAYAAPYLDFIGTGENFYGDDTSDAIYSHDRAVAYHKSLGFLNTELTQLPPVEAEQRFRMLLFYHIYPGLNTGDLASIEPARPLFQKYIPLMKAMGAAGWEPVTYATVSDPAIRVERYGRGNGGEIYFALRNPTNEAKQVALNLKDDFYSLLLPYSPSVPLFNFYDALHGTKLEPSRTSDLGTALSIKVPAHDTVVIRVVFKS